MLGDKYQQDNFNLKVQYKEKKEQSKMEAEGYSQQLRLTKMRPSLHKPAIL